MRQMLHAHKHGMVLMMMSWSGSHDIRDSGASWHGHHVFRRPISSKRQEPSDQYTEIN